MRSDLLQAGSVKVQIEDLRPLERAPGWRGSTSTRRTCSACAIAAGQVNLMLAAETPAGDAGAGGARAAADHRGECRLGRSVGQGAVPAAGGPSASGERPGRRRRRPAAGRRASPPCRSAPVSSTGATRPPRPQAALAVQGFSFDAQAIAWPLEAPVVFKGEGVARRGQGPGQARVLRPGQRRRRDREDRSSTTMPLVVARPYLQGVLRPPLAGALSADLTRRLEARRGRAAAAHRCPADRASPGCVLGDAEDAGARGRAIELLDARIDTVARSAASASWRCRRRGCGSTATRTADGTVATLAGRGGAASTLRPRPPRRLVPHHCGRGRRAGAGVGAFCVRAGRVRPWRLSLGTLAIDKGRASFTDRSLAMPAALDLHELSLQAQGWALDGAANDAVPAAHPGRGAGRAERPRGRCRRRRQRRRARRAEGQRRRPAAERAGDARAQGPAAAPARSLPRRPCPARRAEGADQLSRHGRLGETAARPALALRGDATVDDFRATSPVGVRTGTAPRGLAMVREPGTGPSLLNWKSLSLRGIDVALAPGARPRVTIAETALSDFFARVVLDEQGRLNLQEVARAGDAASAPAAASGAAPRHPRRRRRRCASAAAAPPAASGPTPIVNMGPIARRQRPGRVQRSLRQAQLQRQPERADRSARRVLVEAPASGPPQLADLDLRGRVEGTASLEITGKVNPLAKPVALDLKAKVRELELPPLSPYAIKYAGYGIERGKMSVDLAYVVQPDGAAQREQPDRPQPARVRREGRGLDREPAGQARGGAARRPQRRDRRRPAGERLDQRSAVLARRRGLEGDRQPHRQGGDCAVRAARIERRRRQRELDDRVRARHVDADAAGTRKPRQDRPGADRTADAHPHHQRREPAGERARGLEARAPAAGDRARRSGARRSPAAPAPAPRSRSTRPSIRRC